ncbi:Rz1-like lysis system protein LysC [Pectobacterium parmentieri]|uniref:Rz1-like lysis system protein LysC n=1 Tax=Pectobacterium parmentieri TaxID=1905730 RepID=UPI000D61293C|nr:peptidase [Pectobacterium parmentieri]
MLWLSLTLFLSGCAKSQIQYETVKVKSLPIPASLLSECPVPIIPKEMTYGDSVLLNLTLLDSIDECNGKLRSIRNIEETRLWQ